MMEEEPSGAGSSSRPTKRLVVPEVMLLNNSLCRSPTPGLDERKGWDAGWERVGPATVAEAQRDESGRKIQMTVRTLEGVLGNVEIYGRSEKIANFGHLLLICLTSCQNTSFRNFVFFGENLSYLPGTMKLWIPIMKMTCMGPNLRMPSFRLSLKAKASLPTKTAQNQQTLIVVVIFVALCSHSRSVG